MFSVEKYINLIKSNLEIKSDLLVENLKKIFRYNFFTEIDFLDFSAFIESTRFELSIRMFSMDKEANEVFYEENDESVFAGSIEVLTDLEYFQLKGYSFEDFMDFYEGNYQTIAQQEQEIFTNWFKQCWKIAGGHALGLSSYFVFHDDDKSFNLKTNQWVLDEEKFGVS